MFAGRYATALLCWIGISCWFIIPAIASEDAKLATLIPQQAKSAAEPIIRKLAIYDTPGKVSRLSEFKVVEIGRAHV